MDEVIPRADREDILSQAPETKNGFYKVKAIL
jgi:Asp-tRNA(Asn)/Glu-tRNA(Gln) amidotransferase C subunit